MSVLLQFEPQPNALIDLGGEAASLPEGLYFETLLWLPVHFSIDETDLLELPHVDSELSLLDVDAAGQVVPGSHLVPRPWRTQPVIGFVARATSCVNELRMGRQCRLTLAGGGGSLLFLAPTSNRVRVQSSESDVDATTSFDDLQAAVSGLRSSVREWLANDLPELSQHPAWSSWFPDQPPSEFTSDGAGGPTTE